MLNPYANIIGRVECGNDPPAQTEECPAQSDFMGGISPNNDTGEWRNGENYMLVKEGYVYYKFMNNLVDHKERFISHDEIMGYLEKFNWKCLHQEIGAGSKHSLTSSYTYYIVEKY